MLDFPKEILEFNIWPVDCQYTGV